LPSYNFLKGGCGEMGFSLFLQVTSDGTRGNGLKLCRGRFSFEMRRNFFFKKSSQTLEQVAQGGGGVTVPGGVQGKVGRGA